MADVLAEGYNVFDTVQVPQRDGQVPVLARPTSSRLIQSGKLQEHILLVPRRHHHLPRSRRSAWAPSV
jgi:hypothetical protein